MKVTDLSFLASAVSGLRETRWNKEIFKAFFFGLTVGAYLIYASLHYIEESTNTAIKENLE